MSREEYNAEPPRTREEYLRWLDENSNDFECARCGATCNGERVKTRFGVVDPGCYLHWRKVGKLQQRTIADFGGEPA